MIGRIFTISALALFAGSLVESARSAQLFVCDNGKAIKIESTDLEAAKRTNPCVARYFGLTIKVDQQPKAKRSQQANTVMPSQGADLPIELPVRKPNLAKFRKTVSSHQDVDRRTSPNRIAKAEPVDFRKVRIINAAPGSAKWFNHRR